MVEGSGVKVEMPDEAESSVVLRVLLVEDDPFQQMALSGIIARVEAENAQLTVQLKIAGTGDEALAALEAVESHLVLLDYKLPGGDADTLLPGIRERVGPLGAIVVLSAAEREAKEAADAAKAHRRASTRPGKAVPSVPLLDCHGPSRVSE